MDHPLDSSEVFDSFLKRNFTSSVQPQKIQPAAEPAAFLNEIRAKKKNVWKSSRQFTMMAELFTPNYSDRRYLRLIIPIVNPIVDERARTHARTHKAK